MSITAEQLAAIMPAATELLSDEPEMESSLHALQLRLLVNILEWHWRDRGDFFIGANLTIYFSREQLKTHDFRGPDFFLVNGVERRHRNSWVVWEEGKFPDLIIELLSDSTAAIDREIKKEIYERRFRTPEYFWFSPQTCEIKGFRLNGDAYHEITPDKQGLLWSQVLNLHLGVHDQFLRFFNPGGELLATPEEAAEAAIKRAEEAEKLADLVTQAARHAEQAANKAEQAHQLAEQEAQRVIQALQLAEKESQRAERLAGKLRELGIDPNNI